MKKISKFLFLAVSAMLLLVPMLATNIKPDQVSEIDNTKLREFPALHIGGFRSGIEGYVSDRIGLRGEMITMYQKFCDIAFHKLVHPSYIYGKDGHIMAPWDLVTYQHLDVSEEYINNFTDYLESLAQFCQSQGAEFLFYLCPNKETIYPEYFPDGYNVKNQPNRSDRILEQLKEKGVTYLYPKEIFLSLKENELLYNVKYDTGHWNDTGAFFGHQQIVHYLNKKFAEMGELEWKEFEVTQVRQQSLLVSHFEIDEMVPYNVLVDTDAVKDEEIFGQIIITSPMNYYICYKNETAMQNGKPKVLIFGDSYFGDSAKYYMNHSSELVLMHSTNMPNIEYYISAFRPDIVIYEAVERVLQSEWDSFKATKRYYEFYDLQNGARETGMPFAEQVLLDIDIEALQAQAIDHEFVSLSGILNERVVANSSEIFALVAVLNGKEYYSIFDKGALSYQFAFRAEDIAENTEISFWVLKKADHIADSGRTQRPFPAIPDSYKQIQPKENASHFLKTSRWL